jgi:Uma2 family endonuclease
MRLSTALNNFVTAHRLGVVLESSTGFRMHNRNCRAPDVSFIPKERLKRLGFRPRTRQFFPGAPDLAVEILSPNNTRAEIDERLRDFFASGTKIAWIINPDGEGVEVCHSPTQRKLIGSGGLLEGEDLLPGFQFPIAACSRAGIGSEPNPAWPDVPAKQRDGGGRDTPSAFASG